MNFQVLKQQELPVICSIFFLFLIDSFAYYGGYFFTENSLPGNAGILFPWYTYFIIIVTFYLLERYNPSPRISMSKEAKVIIKSIYFIIIIYSIGKILMKSITIEQFQYNILFLHLFLILDIPLRFIIRSTQRLFLNKGIGGRATILWGAGKDAQNLAKGIINKPTLGFDLKGYFNQSESKDMSRYCLYLGKNEEIYSYVQVHNIQEMIIILDSHGHDKLLEIIGRYELLGICIKIIPDMYESISGQVRIDMLNGIPLLDINSNIMTEFYSLMKRIFDIVLSLCSMIILLPLFVVLAIIVKFDSTGGIFYKQIRLSKNGIRFNLYKVRTMFINSEKITGPVWADKNDPRVTSVGKVLRKFHLDEIPQLYNVFKGQMSIVGPRPERPRIADMLIKEIPYYPHRMKVKPGITGWAQIRGVYDTSLEDVYIKLKHDFFYIENMSIFLDIKILLLTVWTVLKGKGQ